MEIRGAELAVFRSGSGAPVVFVHGSASDHRTWSPQVAPLSERFEVITYSRRYHRPNDHIASGADYSMSQHADDLEALIKKLDVGPVHLVGHSYGGMNREVELDLITGCLRIAAR